jgi:hypothetical protein
MKAISKNFYSTDIDTPLANYIPSSPDNFGFLARLIVGEEKLGGEESFDVFICTPLWLISNHKQSDIITGRHYLIVFEYNHQNIYNKLKNMIENIEADTWNEIGLKIGYIGKWEFE